VFVVDAGVALDQLGADVAGGTHSGGGDGDLAGILFERGQKFVEGLVGGGGVDADDHDVSDGEIDVPIFPDVGVEHSLHTIGGQVGGGAGCPGVAIPGSIETRLGAHGPRGAGLVDDDELGAEGSLKFARGKPGDLIGGAAGSPGYDHVDRLGGLPGRLGRDTSHECEKHKECERA